MDPACQPSQHRGYSRGAQPIVSSRQSSSTQSVCRHDEIASPPVSQQIRWLAHRDYVARAEAEATRPPTTTAKCPEDSSEGGTGSAAGAAKDADSASSGGHALRIQCSIGSRRTSSDASTPSKPRKAGWSKGKGQKQPSPQRRSLVGDRLQMDSLLLATSALQHIEAYVMRPNCQ